MTTPTLLTDFVGEGLAANMPVTPNVPAGCTAFYYQTDTTTLKAWTGSAWVTVPTGAAATPPAIVQSAFNSGASIKGATFGVAPTNGNLLLAISSTPTGVATGSTGWNLFSGLSPTGVFGANQPGIFWKLAGAAESTTQNPWQSTAAGAMAIYEISGGSPSIWLAALNQTATTQAENVTALKTGGIIIGAAINRTDTALASSFTGATADGSATGGGFSVQGLHVGSPVSGTNTVTVNWPASKTFDFYLVNLF